MASFLRSLISLPFDLAFLSLRLVISILPSFRPDRRWTYAQAIRVYIIKVGSKHMSFLNLKPSIDLLPGREKDRFAIANPAAESAYAGPTADDTIRPEPVGLTWKPAVPQKSAIDASTIVALNFHGGAYVIGTGRDVDTAFTARTLIRHLGCTHVCSPTYRLAGDANGHFPAALQDAITSYLHLVRELKIPASQIIFSGDSAGGNLALALLRYINDHGEKHDIPMPGALTLWSPWVDIRDAIESYTESKANYSTDYLTTPFCQWGAIAFTKNGTIDPSQPYLSPLLHPFPPQRGQVPIFIQVGEKEILYRDDVLLAERLESVGWPVKLFVSPACPHDIILLGATLGFEKEAEIAAEEARDYFTSTTALQLKA